MFEEMIEVAEMPPDGGGAQSQPDHRAIVFLCLSGAALAFFPEFLRGHGSQMLAAAIVWQDMVEVLPEGRDVLLRDLARMRHVMFLENPLEDADQHADV